jgi:hypothetical protein
MTQKVRPKKGRPDETSTWAYGRPQVPEVPEVLDQGRLSVASLEPPLRTSFLLGRTESKPHSPVIGR